jgi:hypothetical protein
LGVTLTGGKVKAALELHDSRIDRVDRIDGGAVIHFSHAYIHKSAGTPGKDPGTGWSQEAQLVLAAATDYGNLPPLPVAISDGYLEVGDIRHGLIPLPFSRRGKANLWLVLENGAEFQVTGERPVIELIGPAKFLENVP